MVLGRGLTSSVHKTFQSPPWDTAAEVDAFLGALGRVSKSDIVKSFDIASRLYGSTTQQKYSLVCMALIGLVQRAPHPDLFAPLLKTMRRPNRFLLETLGHVLPLVNQPSAHGDLIAYLSDERAEVRAAAATLLERLFSATTLEAVAKSIRQRDFAAAGVAVGISVRAVGVRALPLVLELSMSKRVEHRVAAAGLLRQPVLLQGRSADVMPRLRALVADVEPDVATAAFKQFTAICDEDGLFEVQGPALERGHRPLRFALLDALARFPSPRAIQLLEHEYAAGPSAIRVAVLQSMEKMAVDAVVPTVVEAMENEDIKVQVEAVRVLKAITVSGDIDAARAVVYLLKSPEVRVRRLASEVAASIPGDRANVWPRLVRFLRDEDWWVRERVLDGLLDMAKDALLPALATLLQDEAAPVRRIAVQGLARLKLSRALGAIVRCVDEETDWWTREEAVLAIGEIGDPRGIPHLLRFLSAGRELEVSAIDALIRLGVSDKVEEVAPHLTSDQSDVRLAALRYLDAAGGPQHAPLVMELAFDDDIDVLESARAVLLKWDVGVEAGASTREASILDAYLAELVNQGGDDLFVIGGRRIYMKHRGQMIPLTDVSVGREESHTLITPILSPEQSEQIKSRNDVDLSYHSTQAATRFRANVFLSDGGLGAVFRRVSNEVHAYDTLGLPAIVRSFSTFKNGLVLVGGPPGSGKSTTLSALIDLINRSEARHIITVEDPVEAVQRGQKSIISQREVGTHTRTFHGALRSILRQDPDVVLIGELRDAESISFALRAAETGHLVLGTVHTFAADTTVERLINSFPAEKREMARSMLSENLRAVLCQVLLERSDGGRALATEVMMVNDAIRNKIRKNQAQQIPSMITLARDQGMCTMDMSLRQLYEAGAISDEVLYARLRSKELYEEMTNKPSPVKALEALDAEGPHGPN